MIILNIDFVVLDV